VSEWKLSNIPLDNRLAASRRGHVSRLLKAALEAAAVFARGKLNEEKS
jgi:hypothetical protein